MRCRCSWVLSRLVAAVLVLVWLDGAGAAVGQGFERIDSYDVSIVVTGDGVLEITEVIAYDFGSYERHGIYRDIPTRFRYDDRYDRVTPIDVLEVTGSPGTPDDYQVDQEGSLTRIRIGDPDVTIDGPHTYTIRYRVRGAINGFDDHDELYWDAVGDQWPVTIGPITVDVSTPGSIGDVACFAGPSGSSASCDGMVRNESGGATFAQARLDAYEGLTVVVAMPTGTISPAPAPLLEERWSFSRAFDVRPATLLVGTGVLAASVGAVSALMWRHGRDRRYVGSAVDAAMGTASGEHERVPLFGVADDPVEFEPPNDLRPGQLGTILDEKVDLIDVTATIVDLAIRGHLRIEELEPDGIVFKKRDYKLVRLQGRDGPALYEAQLMASLFDGEDDVTLSSLKRTWHADLATVQKTIYDDAVTNGWFPRRPDVTRTRWRVLGVIALVAGVIGLIVVAAATTWGLAALPLPVFGLLLIVLAGRMPHRSAHGRALLGRIRGFRRLFDEGDEDLRARFAERTGVFTEYLPYAIVFGCSEKWAKAFEPLGRGALGPSDVGGDSWYVGRGMAVHPLLLAGAMDDFATTATGTLYAAAASSGGSGFSGGSSGGGFGGGGGGSW